MASTLHPAKVLLLAVHFAQHADIDSLSILTSTHTTIIHDEILLRILLTHLPETERPATYVGFLRKLVDHSFEPCQLTGLDTSPVNSIDDNEAVKRATKLHLLPLVCRNPSEIAQGDALSRFLFLRIHQMNEETGMLAQLLDLLLPFGRHSPGIHKWAMSTVIPYVRKGLQYRTGTSPAYSLTEFEKLPDHQAVDFLLCPVDSRAQPRENVDHDLRSIIGPWVYDTDRWENSLEDGESSRVFCPGWHQVCEWLLSQATLSWPTAVQAIERWGGPEDVEFGHGIALDLPAAHRPSEGATNLLLALTRSAYILTLFGSPSSPRRVGDLAFLHDERDQRSEISKLLRTIAIQASKENEDFLLKAREFLLWLRDWGHGTAGKPTAGAATAGALGMLSKEYVEAEFLKLLLSREHYSLARNLYDDGGPVRLPVEVVQDSVYESALSAFDNATNPNRSRGGLKRCDEIIHALPKTVGLSLPGTKRIIALLKATHALSDYRLVLKQGEPFSPVVLRVHSDPIFIIEKVLEQNPRAYTRLQEFLEMGMNMVRAGLPSYRKLDSATILTTDSELNLAAYIAERRITAMCIEAALKEDDFETAYSYVASRLSIQSPENSDTSPWPVVDEWSWKAALQAGQYIRTERSQQPTHLGTASGNLEIRHLEQRIECLATALRVAPTSQLQEILKSFRRCEEQLDSAIKEEAANELALGEEARVDNLPGAFDQVNVEQHHPVRNMTATVAAQQTEEAPMSLFDLSRATARAAQRNFTAIPSLQSITRGADANNNEHEGGSLSRIRKRDQLREAATGTLVSGVGWLIGANVGQNKEETS
ncbi:protein transport protein Sec39 [Metarhizium guizhouense ARSEF 977]|uniref:Protein transport protein Sec39 n=1 Tax=Metarhizium guizhouense (strain ARSEF 977) TaxID=1276136 RepID=A0A0B4HAK5_METGA|nr:protein transport protein Sec39 [Metarhizium guizhouense ARSEF 977]